MLLLPIFTNALINYEYSLCCPTFRHSLCDYVRDNEIGLYCYSGVKYMHIPVTHQPNGSQISSSLKHPLSKTNQRKQASTPFHSYSLLFLCRKCGDTCSLKNLCGSLQNVFKYLTDFFFFYKHSIHVFVYFLTIEMCVGVCKF